MNGNLENENLIEFGEELESYEESFSETYEGEELEDREEMEAESAQYFETSVDYSELLLNISDRLDSIETAVLSMESRDSLPLWESNIGDYNVTQGLILLCVCALAIFIGLKRW